MADDAVANCSVQVEPVPVALEDVDHPQGVLVVAEAAAEPLAQTAVERLFTHMAEGGMAEVVTQADGLDQILIQGQCAGHGAGDLRDLQRVREPGAVVVAAGGDEDLRFVLEPAEGLGVHDPVAVALERGAQTAVRLRSLPVPRIGAHGQGR